MISNQPQTINVDLNNTQKQYSIIRQRLSDIAQRTGSHWTTNINNLEIIDNDKIIWGLLFDGMPSHQQWTEIDRRCQILGKKIWFVTDNIVEEDRELRHVKIFSFPELMAACRWDDSRPDVETQTSKLYNCFMQRTDSIRQSWLYFLWLHNLLDQGYVSYLLYQLKDFSSLRGPQLFDFIHHEKGLDSLEKFQAAHLALRHLVPFRNFSDSDDLSKYIRDSKYSVILETYAIQDDQQYWCITEKTLRSLQLPCISLIFAQKYSVQKLNNLGFEIDPINEKWDGLEWIQRQQAILDVLLTNPVDREFDSLRRQCQHNRDILRQWQDRYQRDDFFDQLEHSVSR